MRLIRVAPFVLLFAAPLAFAAPETPQPAPRYTAETPEAMIAAAQARATAPRAADHDRIAALATVARLADRAPYGAAHQALGAIAQAPDVPEDVRGEARLVDRALSADEGSDAGAAADRALGVLTELALLGPFRDTGGGVRAKDGPEAQGASFGDVRARYSWGTVDVAWRAVPRSYATAAGVPLDVFVHPRKESCTWVASKVDVPAARAIVVRVAATGQVRLVFDGVDLGTSEETMQSADFDRLAAKVDASAGPHLVAAKVCSGALEDEGRVRLRLTDDRGAPLALAHDRDLTKIPPAPKRLATARVETPLGRTLAAGGLDAAIARTLGGADDMASPRAPGILAELIDRGSPTPDQLAMAAWIATSDANRSGWLNMAKDRASRAGDAATSGFVARRIVAQHLAAGLVDWAMMARRAAHLDDAKDPEAALIVARSDESLGTDATRLRAMQRLAALVDASPDAAPTAALHDLARVAASFDPARALAARELLVRRGIPSSAWVEASGVRGQKAVVDAAMRTFDGGLDDVDEGLAAARAVAHAGAHAAARDLYARLVQWGPNRPETWAALADELAAAPAGDDAQAAVTAALTRARELAPTEARYRAELALRTPPGAATAGENGAEARVDEKYLVPSQVVLARRGGAPPPGQAPDVADRQLYSMRAVVMHPDRRVSMLFQYGREIVIAPRTEDELEEDIQAEGDLFEILRARVHRKDGGTAFPTEEENEGSRPRIKWPELHPGDTVEVVVRTWTRGPVGGRGDPPFYFLDYAGSVTTHPLLFNEVVVESPPDRPIYVDVAHPSAMKRLDSDENGRHVVRLTWDRPPNVPDEPLAPQVTEIVPITVGSTFRDWNMFRAWYAEATRGFTDPDDQVRELAARLTKGKTTREDKLRAIFDFVADDIRYVNYQSGESWLPNRPQELLARRQGDCDDKAVLLITLLKAVGIDANEVLVQTRLTDQPSVVEAKGAAVPRFDHGIAFLPGGLSGHDPNGAYLDATSPQSRLGPLPSMDARAAALRMDGPAEIVRLPAASPADHGATITWTIALDAQGGAELTGEETHSGDGAFWLRTTLTEPGARAQYVEQNLVGSWFPTVVVDKNIEFEGDRPGGQAWVKYRARSDGLARHEGTDLVVPLSPSSSLTSQLAPLVERTLPVVLPPYRAPMHEDRRIRVVAPAGYEWAASNKGGDADGGPFGRAHLEIAKDPKDPRAIVVQQSFVLDQNTIPVDQYAAWRGWLQRVDSLLHKTVRLVQAGGAR